MKKQYFFALGLVFAGLTASAQNNLILNGDFENWTEANPVNFIESVNPTNPAQIFNDLLTKETSTSLVYGGNNSCRQTSKAQGSTQYLEYSNLLTVTPGNSYTISYWYLDNSTTASTRLWSTWLTDSGTLNNPTAQAEIQHQTYSTNSPNWVNKVVTVTAPAGATKLRYQIRTYHEDGVGGGYIYFDNLSFVNNSVNSTKDNSIAGLAMFPNPINGDVLTITSNSGAAKQVAIFDVLGKQVVNATTSNNTINVSNLTAGVYMVKISEEGKTATRKLVVQ